MRGRQFPPQEQYPLWEVVLLGFFLSILVPTLTFFAGQIAGQWLVTNHLPMILLLGMGALVISVWAVIVLAQAEMRPLRTEVQNTFLLSQNLSSGLTGLLVGMRIASTWTPLVGATILVGVAVSLVVRGQVRSIRVLAQRIPAWRVLLLYGAIPALLLNLAMVASKHFLAGSWVPNTLLEVLLKGWVSGLILGLLLSVAKAVRYMVFIRWSTWAANCTSRWVAVTLWGILLGLNLPNPGFIPSLALAGELLGLALGLALSLGLSFWFDW